MNKVTFIDRGMFHEEWWVCREGMPEKRASSVDVVERYALMLFDRGFDITSPSSAALRILTLKRTSNDELQS